MKKESFPFKLKPLIAAQVSEISEVTAAADISDSEKINFHIGNPLSDARLISAYTDLCLKNDSTPAPEDMRALIHETVKKAVPYSPRGGYRSNARPALVEKIRRWLEDEQAEGIYYALGDNNGKRECILSSGGMTETLRVLLQTISDYTVAGPVQLLNLGFVAAGELPTFKGLSIPQNLDSVYGLGDFEGKAAVVLLGTEAGARERRWLRRHDHNAPLLFVELNNAANDHSLARESGLFQNVIRVIDAAVLRKDLSEGSLQFVLGNSDFLQRMESVHFELKGTPSSTEIVYLETRLSAAAPKEKDRGQNDVVSAEPFARASGILKKARELSHRYEQKSGQIARRLVEKNYGADAPLLSIGSASRHLGLNHAAFEEFAEMDSADLFNALEDRETAGKLGHAFTEHFCRHHPWYNRKDCYAVSGSARTAFSLLGRHGAIQDVLVFDMGWSYENAFARVHAVPLLEDDDRNAQNMIDACAELDEHSAVILNNPHNASGRVFSTEAIEKILLYCLDRKITVIDDLCYPNVAPVLEWPAIPCAKEIARHAVDTGRLSADRLQYLITVHSLSKCDCFAGARLSVVETAHPRLTENFSRQLNRLAPNTMALFLAYLFYRNTPHDVRSYWQLRNRLLYEKGQALRKAMEEIAEERNHYKLRFELPQATIYPHLNIGLFPNGLSTDRLALKLAKSGIGLVPLANFTRHTDTFSEARKKFRLTLGGSDPAVQLEAKARRLLVELNRAINSEARQYQFYEPQPAPKSTANGAALKELVAEWDNIRGGLKQSATKLWKKRARSLKRVSGRDAFERFLEERLALIGEQIEETAELYDRQKFLFQNATEAELQRFFEQEFFKQEAAARERQFNTRLFDRTVHPTQMYAVEVALHTRNWLLHRLQGRPLSAAWPENLARALADEYFGYNVPLNSEQEAGELICDLWTLSLNDMYRHGLDSSAPSLLSFWGDWDGSTRPSGQGHRLVAAVLIENLQQLAHMLRVLDRQINTFDLDQSVQKELSRLPADLDKFWKVLNKITRLTHQLEKRYSGLLPGHLFGAAGQRRHLTWKRDPVKKLFAHNDRLERKMQQLRRERSRRLTYFFDLNKRLRKELFALAPQVIKNRHDEKVAGIVSGYRNLLSRFALTPRIHQKIIRAADPFAVETTMQNLLEINALSARFGNPMIIPALQVSMSNDPQALVHLDRLMLAQPQARENNARLKLIPLFEEESVLLRLEEYLDHVWNYAAESAALNQEVPARFSELVSEIFVAGSDLSQNIGSISSRSMFNNTVRRFIEWQIAKNISPLLRVKLGCGEAAQRQAGYYNPYSGRPVTALENSAGFPLAFGRYPLLGLARLDQLMTVQSNGAEHIFRFLPLSERDRLFHHMRNMQSNFYTEAMRIREMATETRLSLGRRAEKELQRLCRVADDPLVEEFNDLHKEYYRRIVYGSENDLFGIHVITYFISRMVPALRDRPAIRPSREDSNSSGQIMERLAQTIPMARHDSMLRAIGHNRAQSVVLGSNQFTTGLFAALHQLIRSKRGQLQENQIIERILHHLPVYDILKSIRYYQQKDLRHAHFFDEEFRRGNSAWAILENDAILIDKYIPHLQNQLLIDLGISADKASGRLADRLMDKLHPDLAVLLQENIFNTDIAVYREKYGTNRTALLQEILQRPEKIKNWRDEIWQLIGSKVKKQVSSFIDLARAIHGLSQRTALAGGLLGAEENKLPRLADDIQQLIQKDAEDPMRRFLYSAATLLARASAENVQLPVDAVRALRDVRRIAQIDQQLLSPKEQNELRYYLLQIARLTNDNG